MQVGLSTTTRFAPPPPIFFIFLLHCRCIRYTGAWFRGSCRSSRVEPPNADTFLGGPRKSVLIGEVSWFHGWIYCVGTKQSVLIKLDVLISGRPYLRVPLYMVCSQGLLYQLLRVPYKEQSELWALQSDSAKPPAVATYSWSGIIPTPAGKREKDPSHYPTSL